MGGLILQPVEIAARAHYAATHHPQKWETIHPGITEFRIELMQATFDALKEAGYEIRKIDDEDF